jgi:hypothetical protein
MSQTEAEPAAPPSTKPNPAAGRAQPSMPPWLYNENSWFGKTYDTLFPPFGGAKIQHAFGLSGYRPAVVVNPQNRRPAAQENPYSTSAQF